MTNTQQHLWNYGVAVFGLPPLPLDTVSQTLGRANIEALLKIVSAENEALLNKIFELGMSLVTIQRTGSVPPLLEIEFDAEDKLLTLKLHHLGELSNLLTRLRNEATEDKLVLPQFRGSLYFRENEKFLVYIGKGNGTAHNWLWAKTLCPDEDTVVLYTTSDVLRLPGNDSDASFYAIDKNLSFSRSDFFRWREMLKQHKDPAFTALLPEGLAEKILEGIVEPEDS